MNSTKMNKVKKWSEIETSSTNQNIVETKGKMDRPCTYVHNRSILRVGTRISINSSGLNYCCMCPRYKMVV